MSQSKSQKTERPTAKRQHDARKKGRVPRSTEVSGALGILGLVGFLSFAGEGWLNRILELSASFFNFRTLNGGAMSSADLVNMLQQTVQLGPVLVLPPVLTVAACSVGGQLVQAPPIFTLTPLKPDLSKLNPIKGLGKLVRAKAWVDLAKASFKVGLVVAVGWSLMQGILDGDYARHPDAGGLLSAVGQIGRSLFGRVAVLFLGLALFDLMFTKWDHLRSLKMSKQEIRDERKQQEGDPQLKSRLRGKQIEVSRNRMIADVSKASVVVTNPTHFAVAIEYDHDGAGVPRIVAKGVDHMARRIREAAEEHGVPIHRDPPLARSLYKLVEVGEFIPEGLYLAVAEVLALVLRPQGARR